MENETNAVDGFLEDIENKDDIFNDVPEVKEEKVVDEPKEEKPLPFHKDPKIQRFIEKEIEKRVPKFEEKEVKIENDDDYYNRLIGNDTPEKQAMIREYKQREQRLLEQAEQRALARIQEEKQRELDEERKAEETLTNALGSIEETYSVDLTSNDPVTRKTRQDFLTLVEKYAPKNAQGEIVEYPDMNAIFEEFQEKQKSAKQPSRAKDLASRGMGRSNDTLPKVEERITFDNIGDQIAKALGRK